MYVYTSHTVRSPFDSDVHTLLRNPNVVGDDITACGLTAYLIRDTIPGQVTCRKCKTNVRNQTTKTVASKFLSERQKIANALVDWHNSFNNFNSKRLSTVGVDDVGDLMSESEDYSNHLDNFFNLVKDIEDGEFS